MIINPLNQLPAHAVDMSNPAIRTYALEWLKSERRRLQLLRAVTEAQGLPEGTELTEVAGQIITCSAGIQFLEQGLSDKKG